MNNRLDKVKSKMAEVEAEIKAAGFWQNGNLEPEKYKFKMAFGMDTMAFSQWLQFVFIPNVKSLLESGGELPSKSQVGAQAMREFDGIQDAQKLVDLLNEFDRLI